MHILAGDARWHQNWEEVEMRKTLCAGALLLATLNAHALEAGDIAFTAFNTDEDGWAIVALAELPVDSVIYFTENEWSGAALGAGGAFNSGEAVTPGRSVTMP